MSTTENTREMTTTTRNVGVIFRCNNCKAHRRVEFAKTTVRTLFWFDGRHTSTARTTWAPAEVVTLVHGLDPLPRLRCTCGAAVTGKPVEGTLNPAVKCGGKCTHAKGHVCECECGGANHGKGDA